MHRILPALLIIVSLGLFQSCSDHLTQPRAVDLFTARGVLLALVEAYNARDYQTYATLLSQDYVFAFQKSEPKHQGRLNREQEIRSFKNMCRVASRIRLTMTIHEPKSVMFGGKPYECIRVEDTQLRVDVPDQGPLVMANDLQLFYLRLGKASLGEEVGRYYLTRWQDVGSVR